MEKQSYSANPSHSIEGYQLVYWTPTLKFFRRGDTVVVAIRGTELNDSNDLKADALIPLNMLETSDRYKADEQTLVNFKQQSVGVRSWYGVAHSLGGAILDCFLMKGLLMEGVSYNPAVEPRNFRVYLRNQRVYQEGDPLYKVMGRFLAQQPEVRKAKPPSVWQYLFSRVPYLGKAYGAYGAHKLDNFDGGRVTKQLL